MNGTTVPTEASEDRTAVAAPTRDGWAGAGERSEAPAARLDEATHSDAGPWLVTIWEQASEATVIYMPDFDRESEPTPRGEAVDPERSMREASRRAATLIRRWCVSNNASRLGTLTYGCRRCIPAGLKKCACEAGPDRPNIETPDGWDEVVADIERFRRQLRARIGREVPILTVIEPHADGALHVHFAFNRYLQKHVIESCWSHGHVDLRVLRSRAERLAREVGTGQRSRARIAAHYLSGYVKKSFHESHKFDRKRYSTTRGFAPVSRQVRSARRHGAVASATIHFGRRLRWWSSDEIAGWECPPVMVGYVDDD